MVKNASAGEKAGWSNGRTPLFSQKDLLRLVGPLLIEQFLAVTVGMADTMMVSRCGEAAISGVSLVDMINNLIIVLFAALATGGAVVVSQYLGAKEQEKANASAGQLILLSAVLGTVVAAVCILFARPMISACYGSIDADVLDAGVLYLKITALSYPFLLAELRLRQAGAKGDDLALLRLNLFTYRDLWEWINHPFNTPPLEPQTVQLLLPLTGLGQHLVKK